MEEKKIEKPQTIKIKRIPKDGRTFDVQECLFWSGQEAIEFGKWFKV